MVTALTGRPATKRSHLWSACGGCHHVKGRGGRLGPDLSSIALSASREELGRAIRDASASFTAGYEPVTLVTRDR